MLGGGGGRLRRLFGERFLLVWGENWVGVGREKSGSGGGKGKIMRTRGEEEKEEGRRERGREGEKRTLFVPNERGEQGWKRGEFCSMRGWRDYEAERERAGCQFPPRTKKGGGEGGRKEGGVGD